MKSKKMLKEILKYPDLYDSMNYEEQEWVRKQLSVLDKEQLLAIVDSFPVNCGSELFMVVAKLYASKLATNAYQEGIIIDSLSNKRINAFLSSKQSIGKYPTAFSSKKSHQKKAKGKAYARVNVRKLNFK